MSDAETNINLRGLSQPLPRFAAQGRHAVPEKSPENSEGILKIECPNARCSLAVLLRCPYCQHGALTCEGESFLLICNHCHHSVREIPCKCGMIMKSSYIKEKTKEFWHLRSIADEGSFKGAFLGLGLFAAGLWAALAFL